MTTDIAYSEEIERQLAAMRADHEKVEGYPFKGFLCPILLRDERVPLCLAHIVNEAIPNTYRGTVVQRQDVDNFYGSRFEADFTNRIQMMGMDAGDILADPTMCRRMQARILVDGEEWRHYSDQENVPSGHTQIELDIGKPEPLKWIVKKSPEEVLALQHLGFKLAMGRDCRLPFLVSSIKAAYLTLFKLMGYNYALSAAGIAIPREDPRNEVKRKTDTNFRYSSALWASMRKTMPAAVWYMMKAAKCDGTAMGCGPCP
jgi:hypothetical protein